MPRNSKDFQKYRPLLSELVRRDIKVKYRKSFLGYLWSLLNPLLQMIVMSIVFSSFFRFNIPNYPLYLICGQTLWSFFSESTNTSMYSIIVNGSLIKKVYIPKYIFPVSRVISSFVTMSFSLAAILIVMLFTKASLSWTILLFPVPLFFLLLFSMGIGMVLSALSVYFRDITHLYSVVTLVWMYLTPTFYSVENLPEEAAVLVYSNPLYYYITFFREIVLYGNVPEPGTWLVCVGWSLLSIAIGLFVFNKLQKNFILFI